MAVISFLLLSLWVQVGVGDGGFVSTPVGCVKYSEVSLCSGQGRCVEVDNITQPATDPQSPLSKCLCNPGWTGAGDMVDMKDHDCSQFLLYVRIMYPLSVLGGLILLILILSTVIKSVLHLQALIKSVQQKQKQLQQAGALSSTRSSLSGFAGLPDINETGPPSLPPSRPLSPVATTPSPSRSPRGKSNQNLFFPAFPEPAPKPTAVVHPTYRHMAEELVSWEIMKLSLMSLPAAVCLIIIGALRASEYGDDYVIGKSWLTTFCTAVANWIATFMQKRQVQQWMTIRGKVARFTDQNAEKVQQTLQRTTMVLRGIYALDIANFCLFFFGFPSFPAQQNLVMVIWCISVASGLLVQAIAVRQAGNQLEQIISEGLDRLKGPTKVERERTIANIQRMKKFAQQLFFLVPQTIVFGLYPFLRSKTTYFVAIGNVSIAGLLFLMIHHCQYPHDFIYPALFGDVGRRNDSGRESRDRGESSAATSVVTISVIKQHERKGTEGTGSIAEVSMTKEDPKPLAPASEVDSFDHSRSIPGLVTPSKTSDTQPRASPSPDSAKQHGIYAPIPLEDDASPRALQAPQPLSALELAGIGREKSLDSVNVGGGQENGSSGKELWNPFYRNLRGMSRLEYDPTD